jgi:hypothetical protein
MGKGYSIHIAVDKVNTANYKENYKVDVKFLHCCSNDSVFYRGIAASKGYEVVADLRNAGACCGTLMEIFRQLRNVVVEGDILLITFSGHGASVKAGGAEELRNGRPGNDEGWCLFDGIITDNQLCTFWTWFKKGVRILVVSDSCYSADMLRGPVPKTAPIQPNMACNQCGDGAEIQASIILLASSLEEQTSRVSSKYSAFTNCLSMIWDKEYSSCAKKGYRNVIEDIRNILCSQTPMFQSLGATMPDFESQCIFQI